MQALTTQTIEQYLHDLAFDHNWDRIKDEFSGWNHIQSEDFIFAGDDLRGAYFQWAQDRNAEAALTHLENARAICNERLTPAYLLKYNTVVLYFKAMASRAGTPVRQDAHMRNLLLPFSTYKAYADVHHVNVRVHNRTRRR
jgi:hypothetical protein